MHHETDIQEAYPIHSNDSRDTIKQRKHGVTKQE